MNLGAFSISLAVKDLAASRDFYAKLGFEQMGGDGQHYLILRNGTTLIGLFQGMFENNILTFNPGWDHKAQELKSFTDVRELQRQCDSQGIAPVASNVADTPQGPAHFVITDPDGNTILIDQHR
ncbi:MAG: VOC family protein [Planctomycetes bacterium]|nr:VOC family protein [Planctomycetota bacterium]MCB9910284.1 VOC family protein [Planctomycetota bacterium]HRV80775.1 VOC family protein [Planctomycetota bacterium]